MQEPREGTTGQVRTTAPEETAEELLESLRRERADFLNYKHRVTRERNEDRERAAMEVLQRLLPLLDELDRALAQVPEDLKPHPWVQGVALSRRRLIEALCELGVARFGAEGEPFDPARHEALFFDVRPEATDRRVAEVVRAGYRLGDRLLRPAHVRVVGPPEHPAAPLQEDTGAERPSDAPP